MPDSCTAHFHSPADIGKAVTCWGFAHNQRIGQGLELAMAVARSAMWASGCCMNLTKVDLVTIASAAWQ